MKCKKCGSTDIAITTGTESKTTVKNTGLLHKYGRLLLICFTCGLWLLVPKTKEKQKTKCRRVDYCTCKQCGYKWEE